MTRSLDAISRWRDFASKPLVPTPQGLVSWETYALDRGADGRADEERLIQPLVFPRFAAALLGWDLASNLSAEASDREGQPDFTPADAVTHPFVFETKGTNAGWELSGFDPQIQRYLTIGAPRIQKVVLTNLIGASVYELDETGNLRIKYRVNMRGLLRGDIVGAASTAEAERLADLLEEFSRQELTREQKLERVKQAPEWNPAVNHTSSAWIVSRVDSVVSLLASRVLERIQNGAFADRSIILDEELAAVTPELRILANRIGVENVEELTASDFVTAPDTSDLHTALRQFAAHAAFFTTAKLLLVRVWEDLRIVEPMLYDGGFRAHMARFNEMVRDVVKYAFDNAKSHYRLLFDQRNAYSWFVPSDEDYADIVYELANTYFGDIESDVLGQVYERMLERIDRKLLGVYYTPRDIIQLIWDLVDIESASDSAEAIGRTPRILDIATGSGGFLVEAAARLRGRLARQIEAGEQVNPSKWLADVADGLNGIEFQRFAAYLAELNLIVQLSHVIAANGAVAIPSMGIISADSLSLHEPTAIFESVDGAFEIEPLLAHPTSTDRRERIRAAEANDFLMDVVVGNPPYIGEKLAAPILRATRRDFPYWNNFVGPHMDYLYWFLILGVSKLRDGGRFGFITTEYWMRADGARPLRRYLAEKTEIEQIILFRDFRLFPDAPGQHSMIVIGRRVAEPTATKPKVSIYRGAMNVGSNRAAILSALKQARTASDVQSFTSTISPLNLGGESWAEVVLTRQEVARRRRVLTAQQIPLLVSKGVETTVNALSADNEQFLTGAALTRLGPGRRPGIQLLKSAEVSSLPQLSEDEQKTLRRVVNTRDIYPYAVVVPDDADRVIYLAKPDVSQVADPVSGIPFPAGLPVLRERLELFRPLLEQKTRSRGEARPWWTLHRARENVVGDATPDERGWAPFCVTTRWGEGGRLVVGLAPGLASPASGLHIVRPNTSAVSAAYIAGIYGSDVFQEIADSLPPGVLRQDDLERLGMPLLAPVVETVTHSSYELADIVTKLVRTFGGRFPALQERLKIDLQMADSPNDAWMPSSALPSRGTLRSIPWVDVRLVRAASSRIGETTITNDLLGHVLKLHLRGNPDRVVAELTIAEHISESAVAPLRAVLAAAAHQGLTLGQALEVPIPAAPATLISEYLSDRDGMEALLLSYRSYRADIEQAVGAI